MPTASPISGAQTLHPNDEKGNIPVVEYSDAEKIYINFRRNRLTAARDARDGARPEWDDMTFLPYYDILKKADDQYVAPRKNAQDTSINLGTIRDKDTTLVEYAMSHDFEPVAEVYDDDQDMYEELAETAEDLVRKSLMMEDWKMKSKLVYRSMVSFGTAMVEDSYVQRWVIDKAVKHKIGANGGLAEEWEERMRLQYDGCQAKLWDLRKCYFGDITKFFMNGPQGQPYFFTVEYVSYDIAKQLYEHWPRWNSVSTTLVQTPEVTAAQTFSSYWTLRPVSLNVVEILRYFDPIKNEFAITLNGVDMLPLMKKEVEVNGEKRTIISGYPLTEVSPSGAIPFAKFDFEPMHDFAYSKAQPAKMRVAADVENMMVKLFIQMFKQKVKPTMGNKSGRQFGPEITDPGTVINDVRDGDVFPILPNFQGSTPADFSFFEIMKKELDKNSVERSWQGMDATQADETATKTLNDQKSQMMLKVAALLDGIIYGNKQLYWLRTYNIMKNWTKPVDSRVDDVRKQIDAVYRTVTVPSTSSDGQKTTKKIIFTKDTPTLQKGKKRASLDDSYDMLQKEQDHKKENGGDILITHMHPELFASCRFYWFYECVPVPTATDPLSYMVFAKQIQDALAIFGPDSLNVKRLKHRFATLTGTDFDTWFISEQELQNKQAQAQQGATPGAPAAKTGIPGKSTAAGPSIATAAAGGQPAADIAALMK